MKEIRISEEEAGGRLDKFLARLLPEAGKSFLYKMMRKKNIVLNGKKASGAETLRPGDAVQVFFSEETFRKFSGGKKQEAGGTWTEPALDPSLVVYEDRSVLAVNKPAGMLSQKASPEDLSLNEYLRGYFRDREPELLAGGFRPGVCNRLDRNTSGLVLAGKNPAAARALSAMLKERSVRKYYLCLVLGRVEQGFRLTGYLEKHPASNRSEVYDSPREGCSYIETAAEPVRSYGDCTLLKVELVTGRSHQIRCHLAHAGHPAAGDVKYGDREANRYFRQLSGLNRQFLHAWQAEFPETEGILREISGKTVTAPLPEDLENTLKRLQQRETEDDGR
jgi:23S rRNA pseudouridine955/2504/2580 synthase